METLGSTTTICTDKTGTLTANQMSVAECRDTNGANCTADAELAAATARCTIADLAASTGDPTELALLAHADRLGVALPSARRAGERLQPAPSVPRCVRWA